jgi:predicted amidohydrolase YtcJ
VTHEYVIAVGGHVRGATPGTRPATAIAWAADRVLAVGPDDDVRAISRGDSIFLDLAGCVVTAAPGGEPGDLEPGALADLDIWDADPTRPSGLVARVRGGSFTDGDEHCGPFRRLPPSTA